MSFTVPKLFIANKDTLRNLAEKLPSIMFHDRERTISPSGVSKGPVLLCRTWRELDMQQQ
jgi:hypothetical protein